MHRKMNFATSVESWSIFLSCKLGKTSRCSIDFGIAMPGDVGM